jgi:hypothetical protein
MTALELIDSAQHKIRLARYHAEALLNVLEQRPPDDPEEQLRIALEAHLEALAYTGTAAAEKTIRSVDTENIGSHARIEEMIRVAKREEGSRRAEFGRLFERWWMGADRGTRNAQTARELRNDAAHSLQLSAKYCPNGGPAFATGHQGVRAHTSRSHAPQMAHCRARGS